MNTALLVLTLLTLSGQLPLGDVARQERARQKSVTSDVTFTNETAGATAPSPVAPSPDKSISEAAKPAEASGTAHDEKWWRDAFKQARDEVKRSEDRVKVLQLELNKLNLDLLTRSDLYNREGQLSPEIEAKKVELTSAQGDADRARQQVSQLEESLRRSGGPPGWSRE